MSQQKKAAQAEVVEMEVFDPTTLVVVQRGRPKININKSGSIRFNLVMIRELGLKPGNQVSFSKDNNGNWYLFLSKTGFTLRESKDALTFNSTALAVQIGSFGSFLIAGLPTVVGKTKYWGILIPND